MIKLETRKMTDLTPEMAKHYLNFNDYETQRPIRPLHVDELAEKMKDGLFRFGEIAFAKLNGGKDYMMNGQHVCHAVVNSGCTAECVVENFKCEDQLDMSRLFRQFEILPRSLKDFVRHEATALGVKWPLWVSSVIVTAATIAKVDLPSLIAKPAGSSTTRRKKTKTVLTKEDKVGLLRHYIGGNGNFVNDILTHNGKLIGKPKMSKHLNRGAVVYLMLKTYEKSPGSSIEFWENVRDGEMLRADDAEYVYREFLLTSNLKSRSNLSGIVSNHEYICRGSLAWNAFRQGRRTTIPYHANRPPSTLV